MTKQKFCITITVTTLLLGMGSFIFLGPTKTVFPASFILSSTYSQVTAQDAQAQEVTEPAAPLTEKEFLAPKKPLNTQTAKPKISVPKIQAAQTPTFAADISCATGSFDNQFLCLINKYRANLGENQLSFDSGLTAVALSYSESMNSTGVFSHTAPDGSNFVVRCQRLGVVCLGEILARGYTSPQNLFELWKNSPPHNAIMVGSYTKIGLGTVHIYATGMFR